MESRSTARSRSGEHNRHGGGGQQQQLRPAWSYGVSFTGGVPWPPALQRSSYTCGYCKREFRSAQALGGHMNVHRRERARLRHYYCSNYPAAMAMHRQANPPPLPQHFTVVYSFFSAAEAAATTTTKDALMEVDLELGVGGFGSDGGLDLELRLGCS
ncbi:hypothetical protein BRADI_5g00676v3 [Brachypodium distachyon]|uniref:C2H2-type domain-containing protein n=1 Tax=Brachypodium distachyon TaxID=15368 RepID=A0A0Q3I5Q7_BRADI|nr:hypothetical protein BRADI_5g00676v3 [Brachypodium distachyon]